ncbi:hypothetical protein [Haladaptatus cibarius]|uniref:hypothetical protein n=1 Tax=Haladaptatus cibarius TaxID=453847 RepID=UPI0022773461|nr:hypothetical protein [Haladaptatus cibarius]
MAGDDTNGSGIFGTAPGTDLVALRVFTGRSPPSATSSRRWCLARISNPTWPT